MNLEAILGLTLLGTWVILVVLLVIVARSLLRWKAAARIAMGHERQAALLLVFLEGAYDKCVECVHDPREGHGTDCMLSQVLTELGVPAGDARRKLRELHLGMTTKLQAIPPAPQQQR